MQRSTIEGPLHRHDLTVISEEFREIAAYSKRDEVPLPEGDADMRERDLDDFPMKID